MPLFKKGTKQGLTSSQITTSDIKNGKLVIGTSIPAQSDDTTLASAKAIKTYVDNNVPTTPSFSDLTDTTVTGTPSDNSHIQWDGSSSRWVNKTYIDFDKIPSPNPPDAEEGRLFVKQIDGNNNALAVRIKKAGLTGADMPTVELTSPGCVCECGSTDGAKAPTFDFTTGKMTVELYCGHSYEMDIPNMRRIQ